TVNLIVVSDFNCPWCYVAHKEIQNALARARASHPNTTFTLEYRPFELDPTLPGAREKPMCRIACYKAKFGEEKMKKVSAVLKERGRQVGIDFHLAGKTRQTTNAHRLALKAWLCGGEAAQSKMVDALFAAFFEKEADIGCYDFLSHAAESTGLMTAQHARDFLMSDKLKDEVQCLIRHSVLQEIKGVPFTIVANQWAIQGAETADSFYRV
ncbi:thioredoxin-like protein, partial [Serendipita vermifera]